MKFWHIYFSLGFLLSSPLLSAQELNARVSINTDKIQATNKQLFVTMETSIREFLNTRKWTDEQYDIEERINCQFFITLEDRNTNTFSGSIQVAYSRPVFNSDYNSPILLIQDRDFDFEYLEFDRLDFAENAFISNLTSVLAFYVYIILGVDHDTYAPMGGTPYYTLAQNVVGNAQNTGNSGWNSFGGSNRNRFWLIDNFTSPIFNDFRTALYTYHRQGLDLMHDQGRIKAGKTNIKNALISLEKVNNERRNSYLIQTFFSAKRQEIINIFDDGEPIPLADLKEALAKIDPNNASNYQEMGTR